MPVQFLIHDHAMALAKVIAGILNLDPVEQKSVVCKLCETCTAAIARYEEKAALMNERLAPGKKGGHP
jgi:hypothetical protein